MYFNSDRIVKHSRYGRVDSVIGMMVIGGSARLPVTKGECKASQTTEPNTLSISRSRFVKEFEEAVTSLGKEIKPRLVSLESFSDRNCSLRFSTQGINFLRKFPLQP